MSNTSPGRAAGNTIRFFLSVRIVMVGLTHDQQTPLIGFGDNVYRLRYRLAPEIVALIAGFSA